ncbi:hypothetical protein SDJN03_10929, partial [Cucurbita argyrosperma subsp. sororia]
MKRDRKIKKGIPAPLSMGQPVKRSVEKASKIREGKVRDWDWGLGIGIGIGDWGLGLGLGIGDWDWDWGLGLGIGIGIGDWEEKMNNQT